MNRFWLYPALAALLSGCASSAYNKHLDEAYKAYSEGDCSRVISELSRTEPETVREWTDANKPNLSGLSYREARKRLGK